MLPAIDGLRDLARAVPGRTVRPELSFSAASGTKREVGSGEDERWVIIRNWSTSIEDRNWTVSRTPNSSLEQKINSGASATRAIAALCETASLPI